MNKSSVLDVICPACGRLVKDFGEDNEYYCECGYYLLSCLIENEMDTLMQGFPQRLRGLREQTRPLRSMSVTSNLMGLPTSSLRRYERGEAVPKLDALVKIADFYHVSVDYLIGRSEKKK